ncbi:ABC transporter ATP-binding protein [Microbacterium gorillae]|uniref:ABC transporter ATP-binding protein n=1 Tax=Microbacterium gorillae TaxID=1231063 RepID=UPI000AFDF043|nr:ABC transporter ATP-binding protein [Microbacterium gorillae]
MSTALLETRSLGRSFGKLEVLSGLDFRVEQGEVLGIIGPNGAGKSTLLAVLGGSVPPSTGSVHYGGEDVTRRPAHWRARHGIATSYQVPRPFLGMTVLENLLVGARFGAGLRGAEATASAVRALELTNLTPQADALAGSLRLLDRKRLEVARALAARPRVLLLDEVAGGLTEQELPPLIDLVRTVRDSGVTVVWIEHVVHALTAVASRLMCLTYGRLIADGAPEDVLASPEVRAIYLGIEPELGEGDAHADA